MHLTSTTAALILSAWAAVSSACTCTHNNDAGRWKDSNSPAAAAVPLINANGGCYKATIQGNMCITFSNPSQDIKNCLAATAANWQSFHGDWFLWTSINCEAGGNRGTLSIT